MNKLCAIVIGAALAVSAQAAPWTYRGSLSDGGKPAHGRYDLRLSVLDAGGRQALLPPLTLYGVEVREGAFAVDVDFGVDLAELGAVSLRTEVGQGGSGFVALGSPQPFDAKAALAGVCWDTQGNAGTNPATDFLGTTDAQPLVLRVNNLTGARLQANALSINWTAGYDAQAASGSSAVSIGGGSVQRAWANGSTIAGGANNVAGNASAFPDVQLGPTVGGGIGNLARGSYATVAGGNSNIAQGSATTVAGGSGNKAIGNFATVTGGSEACAGGANSWASGFRVSVRPPSGGEQCPNGGNSGDSDGDEGSFIWGDATGAALVTTGPNQFIVRAGGGVGINTNAFAGGDDLVVSPRPAPADADADLRMVTRTGKAALSFVSDSTGTLNTNLIGLTAGSDRLRITANSSTATLSSGGAWTNASSRSYKHAFESADPSDVLERLLALPLSFWEYKQSSEGRHLGPTAEDFKAAFGLAGDGRSIATVDADGVALAAIQGLNAKLEAENSALKAQLAEFGERLAKLEAERAGK